MFENLPEILTKWSIVERERDGVCDVGLWCVDNNYDDDDDDRIDRNMFLSGGRKIHKTRNIFMQMKFIS